jgi:hypothetical protein
MGLTPLRSIWKQEVSEVDLQQDQNDRALAWCVVSSVIP